MTDLKREYVVPLRRKTRTAPKWRRSKKAVSVLKEFMRKHMKTEDIVLCNELNEHIWANGGKNPPGKVSVIALKTSINGSEKTLVNLAEAGIDKQLSSYAAQTPQVTQAPTKETKDEVVEAQVKEVETKVEKKTEEVKKEEVKEK